MIRKYNPQDAASIFTHSTGLLHHSLTEAMAIVDPNIKPEEIALRGKGSLGQLVEKFWYGYEPNSSPLPDFSKAGVELKTTPLKKLKTEELAIKERLVCDMIDYCEVVNLPFEESPFYRKCLLMLILFYLHVEGKKQRDLEFLFSVLWKIQGKDLMIIRHDYEVIVDKIKQGRAHELSEGDTMYLGACRKGQKGDSLRKQPFSDVDAPKRAFSLKTAYMRTILKFVQESGNDMATNTDVPMTRLQLVSEAELKSRSFEEILTDRLMAFKGWDYKQIANHFKMRINPAEKSKYARITRRILLKGLNSFEEAEEIQKAGIIVKTIRVEANGSIKESMSFENIDYDEVYETKDWINSRWYEIITSRFMFVIFREKPDTSWGKEKRYVLDDVIFWTMPVEDLPAAEDFWNNIRQNVLSDTLQDENNTFWGMALHNKFHVRPKSQTSKEKYFSPVSGQEVPKKCYWFNRDYVAQIINGKKDEKI